MADSLTLLDMFARGIAVGAVAVLGLSVVSASLPRSVRIAGGLTALCVVCWMITESHTLWAAFGNAFILDLPAAAVAGAFWLFAMTVFEDRPLTPLSWIPASLLLITSLVGGMLTGAAQDWMWAARNIFSALLAIHAGAVLIQGWRNDLLEARRRMRALVLGMSAAFTISNVVIALANRLHPDPAWLLWTAGQPYGVALFALLMLVSGAAFLQARPLAVPRRPATDGDARAEAAERLMLARLSEAMAAGAWRREGLTIGELAGQLEEPEHRLRRLINQRLGHRNFADFVNGYRIEAAKARLADPAEARTTVAAIAFDLGYGSLGPFNRAFRAATGATPTEWRKGALQTSPELQQAV